MKKRVKSDKRNTTDYNFLKSKILTLLTFLCLIGLVISVNAVSVVNDDLIYVNESSGDDSDNINIDSNDTVKDREDPTPTMISGALPVVYVNDASGNDANDGSTPVKAKKTIKNAVRNVASGGTVYIADGTYTGSNNRGIFIDKNVDIIGDSQNGTILDAKNGGVIFSVEKGNISFKNLTLARSSCAIGHGIREGSGGAQIMGFPDYWMTVSDCTFIGSRNNAIYTGGNYIVHLTVKNSTFINNTNNGGTFFWGYGGAICNKGGSVTVNGSTFTDNTANIGLGGAIYSDGLITVESSTFTGNSATGNWRGRGDGGAIYSGRSVVVRNSTFTGNSADYGGAIYGYNKGHVEVETSVFNDNRVSYCGGAIHNDASVTVKGSTFKGNSANRNGGAVYNHDGPITVEYSAFKDNKCVDGGSAICKHYGSGSVTVKDSTFSGNTAGYGAIWNDGILSVSGSTFTGNTATNGGAGAICNHKDRVDVKNSTFIGNTVNDDDIGGAIYSEDHVTVNGSAFKGNSAFKGGAIFGAASVTAEDSIFTGNNASGAEGGAVYAKSSVTLKNSTFTGNTANAEGLYFGGGAIRNDGYLEVRDCNFNGNTAKKGGAILSWGQVDVKDSTFRDNAADGYGGVIYKDSGPVTVEGSTFVGNSAKDGGVIYSLSDYSSVTVKDSTFRDNTANGHGGAIYKDGGPVTVEGSTFVGNTAREGGVIYKHAGSLSVGGSTFNGNIADFGGAIYNYDCSLSVGGSTFTGNTASKSGGAIVNRGNGSTSNVGGSTFTGNTAGYGGAIWNADSLSMSGSTFTGNKADLGGGAVLNSGKSEVHFNRIVGNTAPNGPDICSFSGSVNAANNWWGSNDNPSNRISGNVNVGPWLILNIVADSTHISIGDNSTITVDLLHNSNKESVNGPVPNEVPITFNATKGTIDPKSSILKGKVTSIFTAGNQGTGNIMAVVDNQTVSTQIVIKEFSVVYVDESHGSDSNDGSSPEKAKKTIKNAVDSAVNGGKVRIADGTYEGLGNTNIPITRDVSIIGDSQNGTIINVEGSGRVFTVNKGVNVVIQDLTLTGGNTDHGGAIYNDKGSLTIKNSTLIDNTAIDGGAIHNAGGSLSISGSTLTDNHVTGHGGAVYSNGSSLTVCDSTLNSNLASQNGGAIHNTGSLSVSGSTLTGNVARNGGAISSGSDGEVHFNRITGNTASIGKDIYSPTASVNAANNWWGSNDNPSNRVFGNVNVNPWIVLTVKADPTDISVGNNSTITIDLLHNSNNESVNGTVPDGVPVTFTASNGTINPKSSTLVKGKTTSVFTAGNPGTASITVTVDGQVVSTQIIINKLLVNMTDVQEVAGLNTTEGNSSSLGNRTVINGDTRFLINLNEVKKDEKTNKIR